MGKGENVMSKSKKLFSAKDFVYGKFYSAEDKAKFTNQFVKFVESDFSVKHFPKWFYQQLSNTFGHIAHYDREGFYQTWFSNEKSKLDFIIWCKEYNIIGSPEYTFSDVEKALQIWLVNQKIEEKLQLGVELINFEKDLRMRNLLLEKYPLDKYPCPKIVEYK